MIVDNFLLPRFLILELLCACHWFEYTKAVDVLTCEAKEGGAKKGIYELREILNSDNKVSYKFSAVKGAQGLKEFLEEENIIEDNGSGGGDEGCRFSLQGQHWKFPPLLFDSSGGPILPADNINNTDMEVSIRKGEVVTIYCPGKKVQSCNGDTVKAVCDHNDKFILNSSLVDIGLLGCVGNPAEAELKAANEDRCGPDGLGTISQIGFVIGEKMYPVISVCHSVSREQTFYSNHTLYGKFLHYKSIYERRGNFREGRLYFKSISANDAYKQAKQKRIFSALLNEGDHILDYYDPGDGLYLARGHLAPKGDLLYTDWQEASYMYSNVVPQWQRINNGNWKTVEEGVRSAARKRGVTLLVYTGTLGVFKVSQPPCILFIISWNHLLNYRSITERCSWSRTRSLSPNTSGSWWWTPRLERTSCS